MGQTTFLVVEQAITLCIAKEVSVILLVVRYSKNMFAFLVGTSADEIMSIDPVASERMLEDSSEHLLTNQEEVDESALKDAQLSMKIAD